MTNTGKLTRAAIAALFLSAFAVSSNSQAQATPAITITNEGGSYVYSPAQLEAKVGEAINLTNKDPNGVHTVTAKDGSFSVDVPPNGTATLKVSKAGSYPYYCTYHPTDHNEASLNVS